MRVSFQLNGKSTTIDLPPMKRLADVLRYDFNLTAAKIGCGEGECGACTIMIDDEPVVSCLIPVAQIDGRDVKTLEYYLKCDDAEFKNLQNAFATCDSAQCGACTPGVIMNSIHFLKNCSRISSENEIRLALSGNLCRCTGYQSILEAIASAQVESLKS